MRGHGRLLRGLTPPHLVDEVLGKRIEVVARPQRAGKATEQLDALASELNRTRLVLRIAIGFVATEGVCLAIAVGVNLLGL